MKRTIWALAVLVAFSSTPAFAQARPAQRLAEGESCDGQRVKPTPTPTPKKNDCEHHYEDCEGNPDCDECPNDPNKSKPGVCGCGYSDVDSDGDGTPDCLDYCPDDPEKVSWGICGCGVSDDTPDCERPCAANPDCNDECPDDPNKTDPGLCGCGFSDDDSDGDGTPDCLDSCPDDPAKVEVGKCGCGVSDDTPDCDEPCTEDEDCIDECPDDPNKTEPGQCGCGYTDDDNDGDGTPDCLDFCPDDPDKVQVGKCGCGVPDDTPNCEPPCTEDPDCDDACPDDPDKTEPGQCGCGVADDDSDGDGTPDCLDSCPDDSAKTEAGQCGCGYSDDDNDGDGTPDCLDSCPEDSDKTEPGLCGCGVPDDTPNCEPPCDEDPGCETPTPTPTPSVEPACEFYKGTISTTGKWYKDNKSLSNQEAVTTDEGAAALTCLEDKIQNVINRCNSKCQKNKWLRGYCDDCIATGIAKEFNLSNKGKCSSWKPLHNLTNVYSSKACTSGEFYFDNACNTVSNEDYSNLCGNVDVKFMLSCPISLLWEHDYNVNSNQTLANFKLDPTSADSWTAWKASDKAPLLVLDPEHRGVVSDASQLFGNWTFGGKRSASLAGATRSAGKWANGYEALATLDADNNGKVDGSELRDLALWFDANQNGISEAGEVKSVADMGITALYYKGYRKDALSQDLRIEVGYERNVNGRTVRGASVDWFAETAKSKMDLANFYGYLRNDLSADELPVLANNVNVPNKLSGAWKWYLTSDSLAAEVNDGMFLLNEENGNVSGYTFAQRRIVSSPNNIMSSMGSMNQVAGTHTVKNGKDIFSFSSSNDKMTLNNVAIISADGKELNGKTTVTVAKGAEVLTYNWKAVRM